MSKELEEYYNKFCEDKRLTRRHGNVEYQTSMHYIRRYLSFLKEPEDTDVGAPWQGDTEIMPLQPGDIKILDVGAGTGRYSIPLAEEGYDVTALELVRYNLGILKQKSDKVKAYQGNALKLKRFQNDTFSMTLVFGPMYHLFSVEDKRRALAEAIRVTKPGGYILVAYCMNEYSILTYGFKENHIRESLQEGKVSKEFHVQAEEKDLYDYVRLEDIDRINEGMNIERVQIVAADGPANYMRQILNAMDEETYQLFLNYHLSTCERPELLGASAHTLDILRKTI